VTAPPVTPIEWVAVYRPTGDAVILRARLYFEARTAAVRQLSVRQRKAVAPEQVELGAVHAEESTESAVARLRAKAAAARGQAAGLPGESKASGARARGVRS
jgi:hypothetical protein